MTLSEPEDLIKPWDRLYSLILCRLVSIGIWNSFIHKLSQEEIVYAKSSILCSIVYAKSSMFKRNLIFSIRFVRI